MRIFELAMRKFVHLHVHTQYSLLDGQAAIEDLVDKAIADGMPALAITDHGNMFGIKEFFNYVKKKNGSTKKAIKAAEEALDSARKNGASKTGYKNLIKLVSKAWTSGFYSHPRTDKHELAAHREGLIISSACLGGEIPRLLLNGNYEEADRQVKWWHDTFGDDYYLELQRHKATKTNANHQTYELQISIE